MNSQKTRRNDICPCGSGKKYKKCCMNAENNEKAANLADAYTRQLSKCTNCGAYCNTYDISEIPDHLVDKIPDMGVPVESVKECPECGDIGFVSGMGFF